MLSQHASPALTLPPVPAGAGASPSQRGIVPLNEKRGQSLLACGYCAAEKTVGLPFTALMSTLSWKKAALEAVPGLEFHALPADTSPAASKTHLKPVTALRSAGRHAPLAEHRGAPTHNVEGCGSVHIQQDGC